MQRCAFIDHDRSGWRWMQTRTRQDVSFSATLRHDAVPNLVFEVTFECQVLIVHVHDDRLTEGDGRRRFLCAVPCAHVPRTSDQFWACFDAAHSPDAWARVQALYRLAHLWGLQAGLTGDWKFYWEDDDLIEVMLSDHRGIPDRNADLDRVRLIQALLQTEFLLRPNSRQEWTCDTVVHVCIPTTQHARMELRLQLLDHMAADATLLNLPAASFSA